MHFLQPIFVRWFFHSYLITIPMQSLCRLQRNNKFFVKQDISKATQNSHAIHPFVEWSKSLKISQALLVSRILQTETCGFQFLFKTMKFNIVLEILHSLLRNWWTEIYIKLNTILLFGMEEIQFNFRFIIPFRTINFVGIFDWIWCFTISLIQVQVSRK